MLIPLAIAAAFLQPAAPVTPPPTEPASCEPAEPTWTIKRVGGDREATVTQKGDLITSGTARIDTPLPQGYPLPTPPGAIDIKKYPPARRALVRGNGPADMGRNFAFWPLFRHIESRDIAMTSPVEMDYAPGQFPELPASSEPQTDDAPKGGWAMAFLYRTPDMGETGTDGRVIVEDTQPLTVLAIGFQGNYDKSLVRKNLLLLHEWLADHPEWEVAGEPRALFYNGPEQRPARRWAEAQLPIRPAAQPVAAEAETSAPSPANEPATPPSDR